MSVQCILYSTMVHALSIQGFGHFLSYSKLQQIRLLFIMIIYIQIGWPNLT